MQILSHSIKLKHLITRNKDVAFKIKVKSPPARGAWIKITDGVCYFVVVTLSLPAKKA